MRLISVIGFFFFYSLVSINIFENPNSFSIPSFIALRFLLNLSSPHLTQKPHRYLFLLYLLLNSAVFEYDFDTIIAATNEFSDLIFRGRCGSVYKGKLQSRQEIAVKILCSRYFREFLNEINLMPKLRHKNLIHLLGFCSDQDQHFLVYEFMPNSSLDHFIFDPCRATQLSWDMCRNIVVGIARGLHYLHEESGLQVVHLDIKPSNILLDEHLNPKITGFEVARLIQDGENEEKSTRFSGTVGYIDPHFYQTLRFSAKNDVYIFGVTILTIITKRSIHSWNEETLIKYALKCWTSGEAITLIDEVMRKEEREDSISEILRYVHIALLCVDVNPETRPNIDEVLHWFSCVSTPLPEPRIGNQYLVEDATIVYRSPEEVETNWLLAPSPGYGSPMSPVSPR